MGLNFDLNIYIYVLKTFFFVVSCTRTWQDFLYIDSNDDTTKVLNPTLTAFVRKSKYNFTKI